MASPVPQKDDVERWTVEQVAAWLRQMELSNCCELVLRKGIDGRSLMELTEEGTVLWGRDVSIRTRKKIMKLVRQIENRYLISTGRLQPCEACQLRQPSGTQQQNKCYSSDQMCSNRDGCNAQHDYDNGFASDEFDDDIAEEPMPSKHDEMHSRHGCNSADSDSEEGDYLEPIPGPGTQAYPNSSPRCLPIMPPQRPPVVIPERRPQKPFHHGNPEPLRPSPSPGLGVPAVPLGHPHKKGVAPTPNSPVEPPPRRPPPVVSSQQPSGPTIPSRQFGPKPNTNLFTSNLNKKTTQQREWPPKKVSESFTPQQRDWPPKKVSESFTPQQRDWPPKKVSESFTQNSNQPELSTEGGGPIGRLGPKPAHHREPMPLPKDPPTEEAGNVYEVVGSPQGAFTVKETRSGSPSSHPLSSQEPPPLPQRNQDGRDGSLCNTLSQQSSSTPNGSHSRLHQPSPGLHQPSPGLHQPSPGLHQPSPGLHQPSPGLPNRPAPGIAKRPTNLPSSLTNNPTKSPVHSSLSNPQERSSSKGNSGVMNPIQNKGQRTTSSPTFGMHPSSSSPMPFRQQYPPTNVMPQVTSPPPPQERAPAPPTSAPPLQKSCRPMSIVERVQLGDGESIELTPLYRSLMERYFFHFISRNKSKELLLNASDGVYLIRPSTRSRDPLTLCLRYSGRTYNINIRQRSDGQYALGSEKPNEIAFDSVDEIISRYTSESIKLHSGDRVMLTKSPVKVDHIYVKMP